MKDAVLDSTFFGRPNSIVKGMSNGVSTGRRIKGWQLAGFDLWYLWRDLWCFCLVLISFGNEYALGAQQAPDSDSPGDREERLAFSPMDQLN